VNDDGVVNTVDITDLINYYKGTVPIPESLTDNQQLWLDHNRDGVYANAGDVLYALRAFSGATVYPVFEQTECPDGPSNDLRLQIASYSAGQSLISAMEVAVEVYYSANIADNEWSAAVGSLGDLSLSVGHHDFRMAAHGGKRRLEIRPTAG
jgi:hypothetical protein